VPASLIISGTIVSGILVVLWMVIVHSGRMNESMDVETMTILFTLCIFSRLRKHLKQRLNAMRINATFNWYSMNVSIGNVSVFSF